MSDIEAEEINGGHGLKTSLMAGFENVLSKVRNRLMVPVLYAFSAVRPNGYRCR